MNLSEHLISTSDSQLTRRELLRRSLVAAAVLALPAPLVACSQEPSAERGEPADSTSGAAPPAEEAFAPPTEEDGRRFSEWVQTLRREGLADPPVPLGTAAIRVGELAIGTPYVGFTLEEYLLEGGDPMRTEPLTLSLTEFDCVSLVEACLAIARVARSSESPTWQDYAMQMERMRYRGGQREDYLSRLHYFSEWLHDNERRGLVELLGEKLGGEPDRRPLRFMTLNRAAYPALENDETYRMLQLREQQLDGMTRWVVPTERIDEISYQLETGDILAFATSIEGLDVTHAAFAYRDEQGGLRVLHAPLSGGVVEITDSTVPQYVSAIRNSTGILVARPLQG